MSNGLDVALMKDPHGKWSPESGDRHTDIEFSIDEWFSFYFNTLDAETASKVEGETRTETLERERIAFLESLKEYPLLARVDDYHQDAYFAPNEIVALQEELNRAGKLDLDEHAKVFYEGMVEASELAVGSGMGIRLLSS